MFSFISSQGSQVVNAQVSKRAIFRAKPVAMTSLLTIGIAVPLAGAETPQNKVAQDVFLLDHEGMVLPDPLEMEEIWDITLRWYLIWIDAILTDALAELDALEDPATWMTKVEADYLAHGVPEEMTTVEKQDFLDLIDYTQAHLLVAPETVPVASIVSFSEALSSMRSDVLAQ